MNYQDFVHSHKKIFFLIIFILLIAGSAEGVFAYQKHEPIEIKNIQATVDKPYIIEGYEISNPYGTCLSVMNSRNVIIRNNFFHDCGTDKNFQKNTDHYREGYATLIGDSSGIIFENNVLKNNFRGFMGYNAPNLLATKNNITNTSQYSSLWCERCSNSEFSHNHLADNGTPEHFWVPSHRSIGIWVKRSANVKIHNNTVLRSTSDGIALTGHIYGPSFTVSENKATGIRDDYSGYSTNSEIYNNLILDNMEQGIWLVNDRGIKVYNNTIRTGCFTYGSPISTEFNVGDSEFYSNKILGCLNLMVGGANSFNIYIHDNIFYSYDGSHGDFVSFSDDPLGVGGAAMRHGAVFQKSEGNKEKNNKVVFIKGKLAEEMGKKIEYAKANETYKAKGWMACEKADGSVDEECRQREEAKGNQGVPREQLVYSSLMENFDLFISGSFVEKISSFLLEKEPEEKIIETKSAKAEVKGISYVIEQMIESWEATLVITALIAVTIPWCFIYFKRRFNKIKRR